MRLWMQLRVPRGRGEDRWLRSVYADPSPADLVVRFDDMPSAGSPDARAPALAEVRALLFVVDTAYNRPGTTGTVWLDKIRLETTASR
jgi:hypothetical protein